MSMKRKISLFLALAMLFSLSACGEHEQTQEPDGVSSSDTVTARPDTQAPTISDKAPSESETPSAGGKALVVYFSATGTTEAVAQTIAEVVGAECFQIVPETVYTSADLNYNTDCRANAEQQDDSARPAIAVDCAVES